MKRELTTQFVKKMATQILMFVIIVSLVTIMIQSIGIVINNQMALTQMQNDDALFVAMNTYNKLKSIVNIVYSGATIWFVYTLGRDTYKFAKTINTENEKEN